MNNSEEIKKTIWDITTSLNSVIYSRNLSFSAVRMLFLKYAVDNYIGAETVPDMQTCGRAQKMFAMRDVESGLDTVASLLHYIDRAYNLEGILSGADNISEFAKELFGIDSRQKKNTELDDFKSVLDKLACLDLEEKDDTHETGKTIVDALLEAVYSTSARNAFSGEYTTRKDLSKLAKQILDVDGNDVFLDFMSGTGISTLEITKDTMPRIINIDKNGTTAAIAAMLYIMYGYRDFRVICGESLTESAKVSGNKIFVDPPLNFRIEKTKENEYSDGALAVLNRLFEYLSDNGTAVLTVQSNTLFQSKSQAAKLRCKIVEERKLKAVIALPPLWAGVNIGTNLLVLGKENNYRGMVFVDATDLVKTSRKRSEANDTILSDETISRIAHAVKYADEIESFSHVATVEEIANTNYNLVPANYVIKPIEEDHTTLEEIDAQLAELYKQLLG